MKEAKERASSLGDHMSLLLNHVETLKVECTKAYRNKVGFVVSSLMTLAEKLDLTVLYFTLM